MAILRLFRRNQLRTLCNFQNPHPSFEQYSLLFNFSKSQCNLAIRKLAVSDFENYREVLKLMDYVLLNNRKIAIDKAKIYFGKFISEYQSVCR